LVGGAPYDDRLALHRHGQLGVDQPADLALRPLHGNPRPVELSGYALGNGDWLPADARHGPASLPDHREQLAADAGGARFAVRHEPLRRREDRHPEAVLDAGDLTRLDVAAQPRRGHALQLTDHRRVVVILEVEPQQPVTPIVQHLEVLDVVVVAEQPRDLDLQLRHRHVDPAVARLVDMPVSKLKVEIARLLRDNHYVQDFKVLDDGRHGLLRLYLKYHNDAPVIRELQRVSAPGLRRYVKAREIPRVKNGLGM